MVDRAAPVTRQTVAKGTCISALTSAASAAGSSPLFSATFFQISFWSVSSPILRSALAVGGLRAVHRHRSLPFRPSCHPPRTRHAKRRGDGPRHPAPGRVLRASRPEAGAGRRPSSDRPTTWTWSGSPRSSLSTVIVAILALLYSVSNSIGCAPDISNPRSCEPGVRRCPDRTHPSGKPRRTDMASPCRSVDRLAQNSQVLRTNRVS